MGSDGMNPGEVAVARSRRPSRSTTVARWLLGPYLVALALIVFLPAEEAGRVTGIIGWAADVLASFGAPREPSALVLDFVANIVLFVPFGLLVWLAFPRLDWRIVLVSGCLVSVGIEVVQLAIPSRFPAVSDVIANTAGTGVGIVLIWTRMRARHPLGPGRSPT